MANVTEQQITEWKKQHGAVFEIKVEDKTAYFKKPSRKTLMYASTVLQNNPLRFNEILMQECFLGGDRELIENDDYFLSASSCLADIIEIKTAELKKL
ncbi:MAG: hypothetical protein N2747_00405 [Chitinophagaceae bacterium]|nr:hypothetical protein [Chitinophagaceae bacterium]